MSEQARDALGSEMLDVIADRGFYEGEEIKSCEEAGITVTLPKPQTSSAKAEGRLGKQDFVYVAAEGADAKKATQLTQSGSFRLRLGQAITASDGSRPHWDWCQCGRSHRRPPSWTKSLHCGARTPESNLLAQPLLTTESAPPFLLTAARARSGEFFRLATDRPATRQFHYRT
jgi:hypothetical protein